jgi:hypothetical protein
MTTPTTQVVSPFPTGPLVFKTPTRATLPNPRISSTLPSMTTSRTEGLDQVDYVLRSISQQIQTAIAEAPEV